MTKEFEEAIINIDTWKIIELLEEKNIDIPQNDGELFSGIHRARIHLASANNKQKEESKKWLIDHGQFISINIEQ